MMSIPIRNIKMEIRLIRFMYFIQELVGSFGSLFTIYRYSPILCSMPIIRNQR
jgi:hypothetical protein